MQDTKDKRVDKNGRDCQLTARVSRGIPTMETALEAQRKLNSSGGTGTLTSGMGNL